MSAGTRKTYYVYFDILENGPKLFPSYYDSFEDGGVLVLNSDDYVSVIYKISGVEYETARVNTENGELCFMKPPFGDSLFEGEVSGLRFQMHGKEAASQNIVSITGGPVRYNVEFQNETATQAGSIESDNYCLEFFYVSNGHEVKARLKNMWTFSSQDFFPKNVTALFHMPNMWSPFPIVSNIPGALSNNQFGAYGQIGMISIVPVSPKFEDLDVYTSVNRFGWDWSVEYEFRDGMIGNEANQWVFWIHCCDLEGLSSASNLGKSAEMPPEVEVNFGQNYFAPLERTRVEFQKPLGRRDYFTIYKRDDLANRFRNTSPREIDDKIVWVGDGWKHRKSLTISGSSVGPQSDYPVRIIVHHEDGADMGEDVFLDYKSQPDFGDIRFTNSDGETQLSYWIEKLTEGEDAIFWVNIDSIPASPDTAIIYVYYGNSIATTTSNGVNTFDWFDDFTADSSDEYDIGKHANHWHGLGTDFPYYDPISGRIAFDTENDATGGWMVRSDNLNIENFAAKIVFGITGVYPYNTSNGILGRWRGGDSFYGFFICGGYYRYSPALVRDRRTSYIGIPPKATYHPFEGTPHTMELRIYGNKLTGIYNDGEMDEVMLVGKDSKHEGPGKVGIIVGQSIGWFDVFFVRKYIDPEPFCATWGNEEIPLNPPIDVSLERKINRNLFRKEAFHTISWQLNPNNKDFSIISYRIYRKNANSSEEDFLLLDTVQSGTFRYSDGYLDVSKKYVYVLTSVESGGHESMKSSPVGN
ncbi:MAG: DUF2341 domain-containing protein [Candidatus Aminicenantes bacterium]|nr:MAG: DUF2341 domain-containing protein [Candidatus Aminicenantes bacterium]